MNTSSRILAAFVLLAASAASQAAPNLVANGSFEQGSLGIGSFTGWTTSLGDPSTFVDSSGQSGPHYGQASDGLWSAWFGSTAADGGATISQALATSANQRYVLTFDVSNDNGGLDPANALTVAVGGVQVFAAENLQSQDYAHETVLFTAGGASTALSFFASNDQSWLQIDNIAVTAAPVPEPEAAGMMLVGLLTAATALARRRRGRSRR